jgi:hypothetical protein
MDDEISPAAGHNEGGDPPANREAADESKNNPQNNFPPPNRNDSGELSWTAVWHKIVEGTCVALIFWILGADVFDKHGYPKIGDFCILLALFAFLVTASLFVLNYWKRPWIVWTLCTALCTGLLGFLILSNFTKAIPNPPPRLRVFLLASDKQEEAVSRNGKPQSNTVLLTNDFLIARNLSGSLVRGVLVVPTQAGQSNVFLNFSVDSPEIAENANIFVSLPKEWGCLPEFGWVDAGSDNQLWNNSKIEMERWTTSIPTLLPGDGVGLPSIRIPAVPQIRSPEAPAAGVIKIMTKVKGWPVGAMFFETWFPGMARELSHNPQVTLLRPGPGGTGTVFSILLSLEQTNGLNK